ncbi:MAG: ABC transporter permease [Asgard group archaeon]|nr:ABC transporter permease [Asgard group archaeon]
MKMTFLVSKRVFKFILRDKRLVALMLIVPIIMAFVIGYGFAGEVNNVAIAITNLDQPIEIINPLDPNTTISLSLSDQFIDYLSDEDNDLVDVENISTINDWDIKKQMVLDGDFYGAIFFPSDFTAEIAAFIFNGTIADISIDIFVDNSNPQIGATIVKAMVEGYQEITGGEIGISINTEYAYGEDLTQLQYMVPSILPFAVFFMSFILSIISLITERKEGTLDLLLMSPYHKINIILGYMLTLSVISIIQATILLLLTIFAFNVPVIGGVGAYFAIYIMLLIMGWCGMGLGFLLSTVANSELQAVQFIPMVTFVMLLLSGILMPLETLPRWLLPISYLLPLTYGADYMRIVMIEGTGFLWHWYFAPVIGFVIIMILLSTLTLREK